MPAHLLGPHRMLLCWKHLTTVSLEAWTPPCSIPQGCWLRHWSAQPITSYTDFLIALPRTLRRGHCSMALAELGATLLHCIQGMMMAQISDSKQLTKSSSECQRGTRWWAVESEFSAIIMLVFNVNGWPSFCQAHTPVPVDELSGRAIKNLCRCDVAAQTKCRSHIPGGLNTGASSSPVYQVICIPSRGASGGSYERCAACRGIQSYWQCFYHDGPFLACDNSSVA